MAEIESSGPMPFARYMHMALYEPGLGYYMNGLQRFGPGGDFVTAPELGGLFAHGLSRQFNEVAAGLDAPWTLMEIGAGSGVLLRELLPRLEPAPERCLILEVSAPLRDIQRETLAALPEELRNRIAWLDAPPDDAFIGIIVANEVIDALPFSRFEVTGDGPVGLLVGLDGERFTWTPGPACSRLAAALESVLSDLPEPLPREFQSELCLNLGAWLAAVSAPLARGLMLLVDYGYPRREYYLPARIGGTLVCHYRHRAHFDPFVWPGLTDISAFVDFTAVAEAAEAAGLDVAGFTTQAQFLLALDVAAMITGEEETRRRVRLAGEFKQLVLPGEMGEKFKVMALARGETGPLSGFALSDQRHRL